MNKRIPRVAIQGVHGCFHEIAAKKFFDNEYIDLWNYNTFSEVAKAVQFGRVDYGVMAIENSIAGSILSNYNLLLQNKLHIIGETYLRIELHLVGPKRIQLRDIKKVQSHPIAIQQCSEFLSQLTDIEIIESADTALSAKRVKEKNDPTQVAIANSLATHLYELETLVPRIESIKQNYTRFLILVNNYNHVVDGANKASICFRLNDKYGALFEAISTFCKYNINMTKIQSVPILGSPNQYSFHCDIEWQKEKQLIAAIDELKRNTKDFINFGKYRKAL
jgi:prephenate dehydratase